MASSKTTNISKQTKNVAQKDGKGSRKGRPRTMALDAIALERYMYVVGKMVRHYNMRYETFQALVMINNYWAVNMRGISLHGLIQLCDWYAGNARDMLYGRICDLQVRGLIEIVGKGRNQCNLYGTTLKASNDINGMMLMIEG